MDLKKAYDRIDIEALWKVLRFVWSGWKAVKCGQKIVCQ